MHTTHLHTADLHTTYLHTTHLHTTYLHTTYLHTTYLHTTRLSVQHGCWYCKHYISAFIDPLETLLRNGDMELGARQEEIRILELEVSLV